MRAAFYQLCWSGDEKCREAAERSCRPDVVPGGLGGEVGDGSVEISCREEGEAAVVGYEEDCYGRFVSARR